MRPLATPLTTGSQGGTATTETSRAVQGSPLRLSHLLFMTSHVTFPSLWRIFFLFIPLLNLAFGKIICRLVQVRTKQWRNHFQFSEEWWFRCVSEVPYNLVNRSQGNDSSDRFLMAQISKCDICHLRLKKKWPFRLAVRVQLTHNFLLPSQCQNCLVP